MAHKHLCLMCGVVTDEGDFDCEFDDDHDYELCENCVSPSVTLSEYYTIASGKLAGVVRLVQETLPDLADAAIEQFVLSARTEGREYQDWLDNASIEEIASWTVEQEEAQLHF